MSNNGLFLPLEGGGAVKATKKTVGKDVVQEKESSRRKSLHEKIKKRKITAQSFSLMQYLTPLLSFCYYYRAAFFRALKQCMQGHAFRVCITAVLPTVATAYIMPTVFTFGYL